MSEFEWAVKNGDLDKVRLEVDKSNCDVNSEVSGRYPLIVAADYGQTDVLEYLISKGANVNVEDKYGITPLLSAIYEGHVSCVQLLLQKGANKTGTDPNGNSYIECTDRDDIKALLA